MARIECKELDEYMKIFERMTDEKVLSKVCTCIVYAGAEVSADAVRAEISNARTSDNPRLAMTKADKEDLLEGLGVAPISKNDKKNGVNTKVGFEGYSKKNRWKRGKEMRPIPLVARTVLKGTSWHKRDNFVGRAVRKSKEQAMKAMSDECDKQFSQLINK